MVKLLLWLIVLGFVGSGIAYYFFNLQQTPSEELPVQRHTIRRSARGAGLLEGNGVPVRMRFPFAGQVDEINVKEGEAVKLNDILATLNTTDADHQIKLQQATVKEAQAKRETLAARAPAEVLEKAEAQLKAEQASVREAQERVQRLTAPAGAADRQEQSERARHAVERAEKTLASAEAEYRQVKAHPTPDEQAVASAKLDAARFRNEEGKRAGGTAAESAAAELRVALAEFDKIKRGAAPEDLEAAATRAALARVELQAAQAERQRLDNPTAAVPIPEAQIKAAQAALDVAQEREKVKRKELDTLRQQMQSAELRAADATLERENETLDMLKQRKLGYQMRAPFDALITRRLCEPGAMLSPFEDVLTLIDFNKKRVRAEFDVNQLRALTTPGLTGTIKSRAFGKDELHARVLGVGRPGARKLLLDDPAQPKGGEVVEVLLEIDPPEDAAKKEVFTLLRPGLRVEADVTLETRADALSIPKSYVATEHTDAGDKHYVWKVDTNLKGGRNNPANKREVKCGLRDEYFVEILEGLQVDDLVVKPKSQGH